MWNYPYFTQKEMQCKCGCGGVPKAEFMQILVTLREEAGFPFIVSSGFRCEEYNLNVSSTGAEGPHTLGLASDIKVYGINARKLLYLAIKHNITGIGVSQKGSMDSRFIHLDIVNKEGYNRPWIWSY